MHAEVNMLSSPLHHARGTEHPDPAGFRGLRHPDPCLHHSPAFRVHCGLGRIQVHPVIRKLILVRYVHPAGALLESHREAHCLIFFLLSVFQQSHGRYHEHGSALCLKEVRAFPHPAVFRSLPRFVDISPCAQVLAAEEEQFPVLFLHRASQDKIPRICSSPDLGIPCMGPVSDLLIRDRRYDDRLSVLIVKMESVL